jgi:hypothetical protein
MLELQNRQQNDAYRSLIAAVIGRAIDDLKGIGPECRNEDADQAMAFILSDRCEGWCLELKIDYERIREIAVGLYQRIIAKTDQETVRKKRRGRPPKHLKGVQIRQSPGKRRIASGR